MSVLTSPRVTKTSHTTLVAAGLTVLPIALLLAAAYGASVAQAVAHAAQLAFSVSVTPGAEASAIMAVIAFVLSLAVQGFRDRNKNVR